MDCSDFTNRVRGGSPYLSLEWLSHEPLVSYWGFRSAWALLPPIPGYVIVFYILPWIGRGFAHNQGS
jgi:hypothetical protein